MVLLGPRRVGKTTLARRNHWPLEDHAGAPARHLVAAKLTSGLGVSSPALERYIDLLVDLQLVRRLRPLYVPPHSGAEIDLVQEKSGQPWIAVGIKHSMTPTVSKGFDIAFDDLGVAQRVVMYPGHERSPMRQGETAMRLGELMQVFEAVSKSV